MTNAVEFIQRLQEMLTPELRQAASFTKISITHHAYERGKERMKLNSKEFKERATVAYNQGAKLEDIPYKKTREFFIKKTAKMKGENESVIHGHFLFIFSRHTLITIYGIPINE